ncbi:hypothetical protein JOJ86_006778 [Rhodococcus percolatus]|nr:nitroreductase/quinone reductase family protein [Rhodococcus opacus]MBA8962419.1 hypothetical protein [Rhodococcus opacus]MBP2209052.1 hypothetical protein [Rhodococcus opacus]
MSTLVSERTWARIQHDLDARFGRFGVWLYRATRGRIVRPWGRRVLVLTTRGRRTGMARSVLLQYFPDGTDRIVVALRARRSWLLASRNEDGWYDLAGANSGDHTQPGRCGAKAALGAIVGRLPVGAGSAVAR